MTLIQTVTVGSGGAASIVFNSIPGTFTDLKLVISARNSFANFYSDTIVTFNNQTSNAMRFLYGLSGSAGSYTATNGTNLFTPGTTATANTFGNTELYIPNYNSIVAKSISSDSVIENNSTDNIIAIGGGVLSNGTNAITSITISGNGTPGFAEHSSASLYGILAGSSSGVVIS
jgi:hypothetical protein